MFRNTTLPPPPRQSLGWGTRKNPVLLLEDTCLVESVAQRQVTGILSQAVYSLNHPNRNGCPETRNVYLLPRRNLPRAQNVEALATDCLPCRIRLPEAGSNYLLCRSIVFILHPIKNKVLSSLIICQGTFFACKKPI